MLEPCCKNILYVVLDLHQCQFSSCGWILLNKECLYRSVNTLLALMSTPQHTNWLLNISRKCSHPTRRSASCKATSGNVLFNLPPAIATLYQIDIASNTGQAGAASEPENLHCSIFSLLSCCLCRSMQQLLQQVPGNMQQGGVNGILLDLGISSMQVSIILTCVVL